MNRLCCWPYHDWLALPIRWYLAWVFIYACWHKIAFPAQFALDVATYDILPLFLVNPMAIVLPYVELAAGILLVLGWRTRGAALMVTGMMVMFVVAIAIALARGLDMSCGCFASQSLEEDPISRFTVLRDLGWMSLGLYVAVFDRRPLGLDRLFSGRKGHAD
jgi:putative oxidoreductase